MDLSFAMTLGIPSLLGHLGMVGMTRSLVTNNGANGRGWKGGGYWSGKCGECCSSRESHRMVVTLQGNHYSIEPPQPKHQMTRLSTNEIEKIKKGFPLTGRIALGGGGGGGGDGPCEKVRKRR